MALSLIIFDFDGVILESVDVKTRAFARIGMEFGREASDRLVLYHNMHGGVSRYVKFAWLYDEVLHRPFTDGEKKRLGDLFARYCLDEVIACPMVPGVREVLERWHGRLPLYVASGAPQDELSMVLELRKLTGYFNGIYGSPPGKAELLRRILAETGLRPSEAIMIGDSGTDQYAAEAVGSLFYGRGAYFAQSGYPWNEDLTKLNNYLETLRKE